VHLRTMPMAAPIRIGAKDAGDAVVELVASSPVMIRVAEAGGIAYRGGARAGLPATICCGAIAQG
jgi:hypothetical protein